MIRIEKFKVLVPVLGVLLVLTSSFPPCRCEDSYSQNSYSPVQSQQQPVNPPTGSNNGQWGSTSSSSASQFSRHRNNLHHTRNPGGGYPTESRTGIVVPLFVPMIIFVGVVLLLFFAVVGSAAVVGNATSAIGRHDIPPQFPFARDLGSSAALARDVLSSEQCVERISCEVFRVAKGYKAQNWILSALDLLPAQSNLTKRASRTVLKQNKISRNQRSGKSSNSCQDFQCSMLSSFAQAVKSLRTGE